MPVYDYECTSCGPFQALRSMSEYQAPMDCPHCGEEAPRVMLSAPALAGMDPTRRLALATNERSQHEPRSSRSHGPGCGCCSGRKLSRGRSVSTSQNGAKSFPSARPWMISH